MVHRHRLRQWDAIPGLPQRKQAGDATRSLFPSGRADGEAALIYH
jgi:hypothetical protein